MTDENFAEEVGKTALLGISLIEALEKHDSEYMELLTSSVSPEEREQALLSVIMLSLLRIKHLTGETYLQSLEGFRNQVNG